MWRHYDVTTTYLDPISVLLLSPPQQQMVTAIGMKMDARPMVSPAKVWKIQNFPTNVWKYRLFIWMFQIPNFRVNVLKYRFIMRMLDKNCRVASAMTLTAVHFVKLTACMKLWKRQLLPQICVFDVSAYCNWYPWQLSDSYLTLWQNQSWKWG